MSNQKILSEKQIVPDTQECKIIILHVVNQAVKDYQYYRFKDKLEEVEIFESARDFLFDDNYFFDWGDEAINLRKLCDSIEIDIDWLRNQVVRKLDLTFNHDGTVVPNRTY